AIVAVASAVVAATVVPAAEPGTSADEDAANEPVRTVVAVRSAGIRSVAVVAVRAARRDWVPVTISIAVSGVGRTANSNTHGNTLRVGIPRAEKSNRQKKKPHTNPPTGHHAI